MTFKLGLTGSIGMGKSTTAQIFVDEGCALWDADKAVHRLYAKDGAAVSFIEEMYPDAVKHGSVDRAALRDVISAEPEALTKIEAVVHPLVRQDRADFCTSAAADILVFDIPLLFETGSQDEFDAIACVTVSPKTQEKRVLERGTMTRDQFLAIREKQLPNSEKCLRSDYVIETETLEPARQQVQHIVQVIRSGLANA